MNFQKSQVVLIVAVIECPDEGTCTDEFRVRTMHLCQCGAIHLAAMHLSRILPRRAVGNTLTDSCTDWEICRSQCSYARRI